MEGWNKFIDIIKLILKSHSEYEKICVLKEKLKDENDQESIDFIRSIILTLEKKYSESNNICINYEDNPYFYYNIGKNYLYLNQFEKAEEYYNKALAIDRNFITGYNNLGNNYK